MKTKNTFYERFVKDSLIECFCLSKYHKNFVFKSLDDLFINVKNIKLNSFNINRLLKEMFKNYSHLHFSINRIETIILNKDYLVQIIVNINGVLVIKDIFLEQGSFLFPLGKISDYESEVLKKSLKIIVFTNEESIAQLFTNIIYRKNVSLNVMWKLLKIINDNEIDWFLFVRLFQNICTCEEIKIDTNKIRKKINKYENSKSWKNRWTLYENKNSFVTISFEDVIEMIMKITNIIEVWIGGKLNEKNNF